MTAIISVNKTDKLFHPTLELKFVSFISVGSFIVSNENTKSKTIDFKSLFWIPNKNFLFYFFYLLQSVKSLF